MEKVEFINPGASYHIHFKKLKNEVDIKWTEINKMFGFTNGYVQALIKNQTMPPNHKCIIADEVFRELAGQYGWHRMLKQVVWVYTPEDILQWYEECDDTYSWYAEVGVAGMTQWELQYGKSLATGKIQFKKLMQLTRIIDDWEEVRELYNYNLFKKEKN